MRRTRAVVVLLLVAVVSACGSTAHKRTVTITFPSMEPGFVKGDVVTVEPVPAHLKTGMIVVFKDPGGWLDPTVKNGELLKRIIGVGGDHVKCCDAQGRVTINGKALDESGYLEQQGPRGAEPFDVTVPVGKLWMMGDNRFNSADSRFHVSEPGGGFVDENLVTGWIPKAPHAK
ncbi:MAG: signal peptidase I [Marmoricola sp.]